MFKNIKNLSEYSLLNEKLVYLADGGPKPATEMPSQDSEAKLQEALRQAGIPAEQMEGLKFGLDENGELYMDLTGWNVATLNEKQDGLVSAQLGRISLKNLKLGNWHYQKNPKDGYNALNFTDGSAFFISKGNFEALTAMQSKDIRQYLLTNGDTAKRNEFLAGRESAQALKRQMHELMAGVDLQFNDLIKEKQTSLYAFVSRAVPYADGGSQQLASALGKPGSDEMNQGVIRALQRHLKVADINGKVSPQTLRL